MRYSELLEDLGLENNSYHLKILKETEKLLTFQQKLYNLHALYPTLCYIDRDTKYTYPLQLNPPPKTILNLQLTARDEYTFLNHKYMYLTLTPKPEPVNAHQIRILLYNILKADGKNPFDFVIESITMIDEKLWLIKNGFSSPITWLLRQHPNRYYALLREYEAQIPK